MVLGFRVFSVQGISGFLIFKGFLGFRSTGNDTRSLCTTACKWTYLTHTHTHTHMEGGGEMEAVGWDDDFWHAIGLGEVVEGGYAKIGWGRGKGWCSLVLFYYEFYTGY